MRLKGKVAVVIGASAGIGRAYALALAGEGATVVAAARTLGPPSGEVNNTLAHVVKSGANLPGSVHAQVCDVQQEGDIARAIDETVAKFGRLDVLVNNAALMTSFDPLKIAIDDWDLLMRVNVRGPYLAIKHAAPQMIRQKSGNIINITARGAVAMPKGLPSHVYGSVMLYTTTKAALNRVTTGMADALAPHGIAVNGLSPGVVATDTALITSPNLRDHGAKEPTPEVLGPPLLHLAQQTAHTLTGQILYSDEFGKTWGT